MGWDKRGYYYVKRRRGKRVTSVYFGRDAAAYTLARWMREDRQEAVALRQDNLAERKLHKELNAPVIAVDKAATATFEAAMAAAGYHKHKRSEWRKRRIQLDKGNAMTKPSIKSSGAVKPGPKAVTKKTTNKAVVKKATTTAINREATVEESFSELLRLSHRDESACERMLEMAKKYGALAGFYELYNQADMAEMALINNLHPADLLARKVAKSHLDQMKRDLAGPNPTALESLLAERIALCWLNVNFYETLLADQALTMPMPQADHLGKHLDQAHRRYLGAMKELAQLRKIQPPMIQVNIGENQANLAQGEVAQVNVSTGGDRDDSTMGNGRVWESSCVDKTPKLTSEGDGD